MGYLWEHIVLNETHGQLPVGEIRYWRDKQKHEIDFIYLRKGNDNPIAIECKWSANQFNPKSLLAFRKLHPKGLNLVVAVDIDQAYAKNISGIDVMFINLNELILKLSGSTCEAKNI